MAKPMPSPEQLAQARQERVQAAVAGLVALFESGNLPDAVAQTTITRLAADREVPCTRWSLQNRLLVTLAGTADARGFGQWKEVDRSVRKGAKAVYILAPSKVTRRDTDAATGEETERTILVGFHPIPVFRVEDTDGPPLVRPDYGPPTLPVLADVAATWKVPVAWLPFEGRYRGYHAHGAQERIVLATHDARTWFHELGHAAHMRVLAASGREMAGGQDPRQEIVAETVAAVLCRLYGFDGYLWHCHEYVKSYGGKDPLRAAARVLGDVERCLVLILETHEAAAADDPSAA